MAKGGINFGVWAFIIGLILAVVIALISGSTAPTWAIITLAVLGIIVGLLNVTAAEVQKFLVAAIAFLLSFSSLSNMLGALKVPTVGTIFSLLAVFMAPAAAIVAIKALFELARD